MDVRAKLDRLRSMEPPAALFEPPPWAAAPQLPPLTAAERDQQLRAALGLAELCDAPLPTACAQPASPPSPSGPLPSDRPDLRRKLARLRNQNPPAAPPPFGSGRPAEVARASESAHASDAARAVRAVDAVRRAVGATVAVRADESACEAAAHPEPALGASGELATPEPAAPALTQAEADRKARLRAALRALQRSQVSAVAQPAEQLEAAALPAPSARSSEALTQPASQAWLASGADSAAAPLQLGALPQLHADTAQVTSSIPAKAERISQLRALIAGIAARDRLRTPPPAPAPHDPCASPPPWLQEPTEHGALHVCTRYLEPDHHHGHSPVRAALYERPGTIPSLVCDATYADLDLSRALYLDTETTGLVGGTGTVAFLVGLARFEDESLCVEQLIVPQLGSETPVLARLAERLAAASCLITYNGKSFDWPLLRTRFVLARLPVPPVPPHIDLLHVCRRVWKQRLTSVRLVDMEREVLRFEREDDLPGSEIPARYFEFLRGGSPDRLCPVLEHNQNDLIALAALLGAVMEQYTGERTLCSPGDALHYGKLALRARDLERARSFGQDALTHSDCQRQARAALTLCAEIEHKLGRVSDAIACLERALVHAQQLSAETLDALDALAQANLHFTLAKLYEHEQHDLVRALRHARNTELVEGPLLHGRRLGRLVRRLLRSSVDSTV